MSDNSYHLLSATEYSTLTYIVSNPHRNPKGIQIIPLSEMRKMRG